MLINKKKFFTSVFILIVLVIISGAYLGLFCLYKKFNVNSQEIIIANQKINILTNVVQGKQLYADNYKRVLQVTSYAKLANASLIAEDNSAAKKLLQLSLLEIQNTKNTDNIKQSIQNDLSKISSIKVLDKNSLIGKITQIEKEISVARILPLDIVRQDKKTATDAKVNNKDSKQMWWRKFTKNTLSVMKNIVVIKKNNNSVTPMISYQQRIYLKQNILSTLEQLKLSILTNNQDLYLINIKSSRDLIDNYLSHNRVEKEKILKDLDYFANIDLKTKEISLDKTIAMLLDYNTNK